jgi:pimeloyl-ACP methyl ester carboxylesterase
MQKSIKYNGCQIFYNIVGKGPDMMLIHGFTEHQGIWDNFTSILQKDFRIITPALPAHGGSDFPAQGLSMEFMADCLFEILTKEKVSQTVMIGHSMGGYAMLNFAEKYPQLCKSICLFHSTARADTPEIKTTRNRTIDIIRNNHAGFLHSFIPDLFAPDSRESLDPKINELITEAQKISTEGLIACMEAMKERQGSIELLAMTNIPVGFIIGKQDSRIPFEAVLAQAALPKNSHILILDECGHMGYLEKTEETLRFIRYFGDTE